jgi:hypothetical protein
MPSLAMPVAVVVVCVIVVKEELIHNVGVLVAVPKVLLGLTVTVVEEEADEPLHPLATTLTVAVPVNPAAQVTVPVVPVPEIVFPAPVTLHV